MLTNKQLSSVLINAILVKMIMSFPRNVFAICASSAWLAGLLATIIAIGLFWIIKRLYCTRKNIINEADQLGGPFLRIVIGLAVFAVLSLNFIAILRIFPDIIRLVLLQKTYVEFIGTLFIIAIIIGAWCGIEAIARLHQFFVPLAGFVFAGFIIMLIPDMENINLFPILGNGVKSLIRGSLSTLSIFSDLLMLNILIPFAKDEDTWRKAGNRAVIIGGICAGLIFLAYGLCYVYPASSEFIFPVYQLERLINLSDFFSRLEAIFQFVWSISILLYSTLYLAVLAEVWRESFSLHHSKPLCAPIVIMLVGVALIPDSLNDTIFWEGVVNQWIYIPTFVLLIFIGTLFKLFHVKHRSN